MINLIMSLLFCLTITGGLSLQDDQAEPQRYSYTITGRVVFSKSQAVEGATIYVMPSRRPINGRIPFTKAGKDGRFSIEFRDVPDEYRICAQPGESGGLIPLAPTPQDPEQMTIELTCSKAFRLPEADAERKVLLRLK